MKKILFAVLMAVSLVAGSALAANRGALPPVDLDAHVNAEGHYWLNGTPNEHQRYSTICAVFRQNGEQVAFPEGATMVINTVSNDLDYVVMMAVANLCGQIQTLIAQRIGEIMVDTAQDPATKAFLGVMNGKPEFRITE